ncbi:DegT/DnrJ/EryC1/StrS family aminotransferase [Helicobacter winghamensis]|uniref:Aminotransferase DegT n=1 Tax=Helicobacter winghamensis TaxID=157268 RepID=A0A2N3PHD5_9HELI|nr:aminotransferase class I/II-fold pyridoxal phosphate-dependent enzyme [Helicobacter winghamensis]EEO26514.1 DegT/DnrJ/EryC1/StrS aminotransferase family protein [Helicobacter winghamensis ATCC BAA-430]PKT75437.1 aminotransferase DegT [Helicobacter winghamensis]PKT75605.1 aminotransferase DegT [Helicobacter winghamensis]PKT75813.1 aminotransferase DegT [Helicobacter winghamensis]PKT79901.1 aminotransferase DegT [Helicobacter winghamensis]
MRKIPYFIPDITKAEKDAINGVLENPSYDIVSELEEEFRKFIGVEYAIATLSGTTAFHLCLFAMDIKRGDKIICSVNCHPMFPEIIRHFDAEPIFVDIEEDTFFMSFEKCKATIEKIGVKKLRAIIISHTAGQAMDIEPFFELAQAHNIKIIEDATMALGLTHNGVKIGAKKSFASIFSIVLDAFNPVAQTGVLTTHNKELAEAAVLLRYHGIVSEKTTSTRPQYLYDVVGIGNKYNVSYLDVALCLSQLRRIDYIIQRRQEIAKYYRENLENVPHISLPVVKSEHTFLHFIIKVDKNRDHFARELKECGIETALHFVPNHLLTYYKSKYKYKISDFPVALRNYQQILSLPIYSAMQQADMDYVCKQVLSLASVRV